MEFEAFLREKQPKIPFSGARAVLRLAADGGTVPFLARYRKEQTGNLDEVAIRAVLEVDDEYKGIVARQSFILEEIDRQKKLTPELRAKILATFDREGLEDLYLPYKRKRQSRAQLAREAGIEPLADWIWNCGHGTETPQEGQTLELWAFTFRNEEKGFADAEAAIQGALDILIERLSESSGLRQQVRSEALDKGWLRSTKTDKAKPNSKYDKYFDRAEPIKVLLQPQNSHRYMAMRRGAAEGELSLALTGSPQDAEFEERLLRAFREHACTVPESPGAEILERAARSALREHVFPSIFNEVQKSLRQVADSAAVQVFAENVRGLLLSPPFGAKPVLGVDPGIRTGCKLASVDGGGAFVAHGVVYPGKEARAQEAKASIVAMVKQADARAVAVGNGTASRETEKKEGIFWTLYGFAISLASVPLFIFQVPLWIPFILIALAFIFMILELSGTTSYVFHGFGYSVSGKFLEKEILPILENYSSETGISLESIHAKSKENIEYYDIEEVLQKNLNRIK